MGISEVGPFKMPVLRDGKWVEIGGLINIDINMNKSEEKKMKIIGVRFINKGDLSEDEYSFICSGVIHAKLKLGYEVVVDTRYGVSLGKVTRLSWANPPVTPYKNVIALVSPEDKRVAKEQEEYLKNLQESKLKREKQEKLIDKMTSHLRDFSPMELCYMVSRINQPMYNMWLDYTSVDEDCKISMNDINKR